MWEDGRWRLARGVVTQAGRTVARLALAGGGRRSLAWAEGAFIRGVLEGLADGGISRESQAELLGVSRRTLQRRVAASEEEPAPGHTRWTALHRRLRTPVREDELLASVPARTRDAVQSLLEEMLHAGWVTRDGGRVVAVDFTAPQNAEEFLEALRSEIQMRPWAGIESWANALGVEATQIEQHVGLVEQDRNRYRALRTEEGALNLLALLNAHLQSQLRREPGYQTALFQVKRSALSAEERTALARELDELRRRSADVFERFASAEHPDSWDEKVYAWAVITAKERRPLQGEV